MKVKKLPAKLLNRFIRRVFIVPPYMGWAEQVREMLSSLAALRIDYAHYHGESMDKLLGLMATAENTLTELLIEIGMAEKELEDELHGELDERA